MAAQSAVTTIAHVIQLAVAPVFLLSGVGALLICVVIATLFISSHLAVDMATAISLLFVLAMLALIGGLLTFLREIHLAIASVRIGQR
jgi:hypothetical protein